MGSITSKIFKPNIKELGEFATNIDNGDIKNEPMFFNCDLNFAYVNGGDITKSFIDALPLDWKT